MSLRAPRLKSRNFTSHGFRSPSVVLKSSFVSIHLLEPKLVPGRAATRSIQRRAEGRLVTLKDDDAVCVGAT